MTTIKDVARLAGVSISTVSRVINDSKPVSSEVRQKVLKIIDETGYKPNDVARSLVTKRSYLVGVIINNLVNSYVADIVRGIEEIGKMYNYDILLCSSYFNIDAQQKYLQLLNRKQAEGIILVGYSFDDDIIKQVKDLKKPYIFFTRDVKNEINYIGIDHSAASYEMTNYLIMQGHTKIAYLSDSNVECSAEQGKIEGYKRALKDNKVDFNRIYKTNGRRYSHSYEIGKEIIKDIKEISAIYCSNDEMAIGLMNSFLDNGIKVPEDISITGYGNFRESQYVRPQLTTVVEPFYDVGAVSMRMLIKKINGEKSTLNSMKLPYTLEERKSVKKIK